MDAALEIRVCLVFDGDTETTAAAWVVEVVEVYFVLMVAA